MITAGNLDHAHAIGKATGYFFNPACDVVISREKDGKLLGGVIFTLFTGASISTHVASFDPCWVDRDLVWIVFNYAFEQLGVGKIICRIPASNRKAIEFGYKLGFMLETRISDVFPDGDQLIISMRRENCRWLKRGYNGRK